MEGQPPSSSSRVKVEYSDPSGVFPLIASDLHSRSPLRNLHWNSPSRPLRSIDSLYTEFLPDYEDDPASDPRPTSSAGPSDASVSNAAGPLAGNESYAGSLPPTPRRQRRHQIPGLRQTPYLKLYLFRCDNLDNYKASGKRLLREWVMNHTPSSQSSASINSQENHDAFEWMIVHVVLPDSLSTSQSQTSGNPKRDSSREKGHGSSIWHSRNSSTLIDQIRADFNGPSKASVDRVVQVTASEGLNVKGIKDIALPRDTSPEDFMKESVKGWDDFVAKAKSLILASFDLRVGQYEEDIKEKRAQRHLPGWNFCTFSLLKEGLARGFESVGLVEDALTGYDELLFELNIAIRDAETDTSSGERGELFRNFTEELLTQAEKAYSEEQTFLSKDDNILIHNGASLDSDRKPYRDLILANNISAFDFQCYIFARQMSLLLRLARSSLPDDVSVLDQKQRSVIPADTKSSSNSGNKNTEDVAMLAELCRRAVEFISSASSMIREDLYQSFQNKGDDDPSTYIRRTVVENLIASWIFAACQQVLQMTKVATLDTHLKLVLGDSNSTNENSSDRSLSQERSSKHIFTSGDQSIPPRSSSLPDRPLSLLSTPGEETFPLGELRTAQISSSSGLVPKGIQELAAHQAELCLMQRQTINTAALRRGWKTGWAALISEPEMEDVLLADHFYGGGEGLKQSDVNTESRVSSGLYGQYLRSALNSSKSTCSAFEYFTRTALDLYRISGQLKSADAMTADIAAVRYQLEDYTAAASNFQRLAPLYEEDDWNRLEACILDVYARCLKKLGRQKDFVHVILKLLARVVKSIVENERWVSNNIFQYSRILGNEFTNTRGYVKDLMSASKELKEPIIVPLTNYFKSFSLESQPYHFDDKDGFRLALNLQHVIPGVLVAQKVRVRLVSMKESLPQDLLLESDVAQEMRPGLVQIFVSSNALVPAWYVVDMIEVQIENVRFTESLTPVTPGNPLASHEKFEHPEKLLANQPRVLVWPHNRALDVKLSSFKEIDLERPRSIQVDVFTGRNAVSQAALLVRAGSAGLRLHTGDASIVEGNSTITDKTQPGILRLGAISEASVLTLKIPYRLDSDTEEIAVKSEISYTTGNGEFMYACNSNLSVALPIGVNVQDVFKENSIFSKFTVSAATSIPLSLVKWGLQGTEDLKTHSPTSKTKRTIVFTRQPASLIYRISQRSLSIKEGRELQRKLSLNIEYQCLDEEVHAAVAQCFADALENSPFMSYSRLLIPSILATLNSRLTSPKLDTFGLLREVDIGKFEDSYWERMLSSLPIQRSKELSSWLVKWHENNPIVYLSTDSEAPVRRVTIPVEVPQMQIVHTVKLQLNINADNSQGHQGLIAVGQAVPSKLGLRYTRKWDASGVTSSGNPDRLAFCYELHASPDTWLIGGQRRACFTAIADEVVNFSVNLFPQRAGYLPYPTIDIRPIIEANNRPLSGSELALSCAIDYREEGETILALPHLSSTTVSLDSNGPAGGAWLVESSCSEA